MLPDLFFLCSSRESRLLIRCHFKLTNIYVVGRESVPNGTLDMSPLTLDTLRAKVAELESLLAMGIASTPTKASTQVPVRRKRIL